VPCGEHPIDYVLAKGSAHLSRYLLFLLKLTLVTSSLSARPQSAVLGGSAPCAPTQKRHAKYDSLWETLRAPNRPGRALTVGVDEGGRALVRGDVPELDAAVLARRRVLLPVRRAAHLRCV
jgi:hypothetical protein